MGTPWRGDLWERPGAAACGNALGRQSWERPGEARLRAHICAQAIRLGATTRAYTLPDTWGPRRALGGSGWKPRHARTRYV